MITFTKIWNRYVEMIYQDRSAAPPVHIVLETARSAVLSALMHSEHSSGEESSSSLGDRAYWFHGWPVGQWVTEGDIFGTSVSGDLDRIVALEIFDPDFRESINWFIRSADRRRYNDQSNVVRQSRSAAQIERELVEDPIATYRSERGHVVRRQLVVSDGRIDIHDETAGEVIECKASGFVGDLVAAATQLRRYAKHFPQARLVIAVPAVEADACWLADLLRQHFGIIEVEKGER